MCGCMFVCLCMLSTNFNFGKIAAAALKKKMEEDGVEQGKEMLLSTLGKPLKVVMGTLDNPAARPKERPVFSVQEAKTLKRKCSFSHNEMAEVMIDELVILRFATAHLLVGLSVCLTDLGSL